jgi:hypothetical protein
VIAGESILREPAEIGHIDRHRTKKSNDRVQTSESRVRGIHISRGKLHLACDQRSTSVQVLVRKYSGKEIRFYPWLTMTAQRKRARKVGGTCRVVFREFQGPEMFLCLQ